MQNTKSVLADNLIFALLVLIFSKSEPFSKIPNAWPEELFERVRW